MTADRIPTCLGPLIKYIRGLQPQLILRLVNTILFSSRALKTKANPDIRSILDVSNRECSSLHIGLFAGDFWKQLWYSTKDKIPRELNWKRYHFSTKSGPNRHALSSCYQDLWEFPKQLLESIKVLGGSGLSELLDTYIESKPIIAGFWKVIGKSYRKITYFLDKEDKTRVIAICDYWSQTVLRPLHLYLFKALKKIPQDMTFDQEAFKTHLDSWDIFYSIDLKSALDRFPIELISKVLMAHLPVTYVKAWRDIMVGYPFDYNGKKISYAVGNPMGATHHGLPILLLTII